MIILFSQEYKNIIIKGLDKVLTEVIKIQDLIKYPNKEQMFNLLIQLVDQYSENKESRHRKAGITAKGILKYFFKVIQPTTYYVQIIGQSVNKIQYRKLLEFYKLDPKDFMKQDPNSLYEESTRKGMLKAAQKVSQERMEKLKNDKLLRQNAVLERQRKMVIYYLLNFSLKCKGRKIKRQK